MNIKFNEDDDLTLKKILELYNMVIVIRSVLHEDNKCCPQISLNECLHEL